MSTTRRLCERQSGESASAMYQREWGDMSVVCQVGMWDLLGEASIDSVAAYFGRTSYITHIIKNEIPYASPYYRGRLMMCAAEGLWRPNRQDVSSTMCLIPSLCASGADMCTNHVSHGLIVRPLSRILHTITNVCIINSDQQLAETSY